MPAILLSPRPYEEKPGLPPLILASTRNALRVGAGGEGERLAITRFTEIRSCFFTDAKFCNITKKGIFEWKLKF
jgi:hypothetical protein